MGEGETGLPSRTRQTSPPRPDPKSTADEPLAFDPTSWLARLAGKPASEALARISNGDPLRLYPQVAGRIRERCFLLDPDRVFERALLLVAVGIETEPEACTRADWLVERIDRAIRSVLDRDGEEERAGIPAERPFEHFRVFVECCFLEPGLARLASVRWNGLGQRAREGFYRLIVEGRPLEEVLALGLGPPERLQRDILTGLQAIGLIDDEGFQDLLIKEPKP